MARATCPPFARIRFCSETIYFISIQVQIILYELSLNYFTTSKIFFKNLVFGVHWTLVTLKNVKISTISKFDEIRFGNYISREESNGEVCFVIRDLEIFQVFNMYYNSNLPFCHFSPKFHFFLEFYILPPLKEFRPLNSYAHTHCKSQAYATII